MGWAARVRAAAGWEAVEKVVAGLEEAGWVAREKAVAGSAVVGWAAKARAVAGLAEVDSEEAGLEVVG